jgi:hypothetical protein
MEKGGKVNETEVRATLIHEGSGKIVFHSTGKGKVWMRHFPAQADTPSMIIMVNGIAHHIRTEGSVWAWIGTARKMWHLLVGMGWRRECTT